MNRKEFLRLLGAGALASTALTGIGSARPAYASGKTKNWAWMRGDFKTLDDWKRKLVQMKEAGIDAVLIGGSSDFYRTHIPAAKEVGMEVHAWIFTMMRAGFEKAHPEWYVVSRDGVSTAIKPPYVDYYRFMCPSREEVRQHILAHVRELSQIDGLTSMHLDYIRYPDVILPVALWKTYGIVQDKEYPPYDFCYCDVCRSRFKQQSGVDPLKLEDPSASAAWKQYRYDTITSMVNLLAAEIHRYGKHVTAAVFPTPTIARTLVRQEWTKWDLDEVLPMVYNGFYNEGVEWVGKAVLEGVTALKGKIPLYAGLYIPDLTPADLAKAAELALKAGARGVSVFEGNSVSNEHWNALAGVIKQS